jgi:hypothetical protein
MSFKLHAEKELALIGLGPDITDEYSIAMRENILKMVDTFADAGHSGFSASYAIRVLEKILKFEPVSPLTGADDEWAEVEPNVYQNIRCGRVFKRVRENDTIVYDLDGRVFWDERIDEDTFEPYKSYYTCAESRTPVVFPYTPTTVYLHSNDRTNYTTELDPK